MARGFTEASPVSLKSPWNHPCCAAVCYVAVVSENSVLAYQRWSHFCRRGQVQGPRVQRALCIPTIQRSTVKGSTLLGGTHVGNDSSDEKASFRLGHISHGIHSESCDFEAETHFCPTSQFVDRTLIDFFLSPSVFLPLSRFSSHSC